MFLNQVIPVFDALGISFAHEKDNCGSIGRAVVRQALLPIFIDQIAARRDGIDIVRERQRDDIGFQSIDDRAGLLGGAVV